MPICHKPALHTPPLNLHHTHTHTQTRMVVDLHPAPVKNARFRSRLCRDYLMSLARQPARQPSGAKKRQSMKRTRERERGVRSRPLLCRLPLLGVGALVLDQCEGLLRLPACLPTERRWKERKGRSRGSGGRGRRALAGKAGLGRGAGAGLPCLPSSFFLLLASHCTTTDCSPSPSW